MFRVYITDGFFQIVKKIGFEYKDRWYNIINTTKTKDNVETEDNRSCAEIASDMWTRIRKGRR